MFSSFVTDSDTVAALDGSGIGGAAAADSGRTTVTCQSPRRCSSGSSAVQQPQQRNLRDKLEHKYRLRWLLLVRAALPLPLARRDAAACSPDAAAAACSQVTGRGALWLALHCRWGAGVTGEGLGGGWWCRRSRRPSTS
jgi:hypothetical protein